MKSALIFFGEDGNKNFIFSLCKIIDEYLDEIIILSAECSHFQWPYEASSKIRFIKSVADINGFIPSLLIFGSSGEKTSAELKLTEHFQRQGSVTIGIVVAPMSAKFRFSGTSNDPLRYAPDWLIVSNQDTKRALVQVGFSEKKILVCGNPHHETLAKISFDESRRAFRKRLPVVSRNQKVATFLAEPRVPFENMSRAFGSWPQEWRHLNRMELALKMFTHIFKQTDYCRVLRLHPQNSEKDLTEYSRLFDYVSRDEPPLKVIAGSDVVVGISSTLLHEAAIIGRPTYAILSRIADSNDIPDMFKDRIIGITGADQSLPDCSIPPGETKMELLPSRRIISVFFSNLSKNFAHLTKSDR